MGSARMEAAKAGAIRYTGGPCRSCGNTERVVSSGACVACAKRHTDNHKAKMRQIIAEARSINK